MVSIASIKAKAYAFAKNLNEESARNYVARNMHIANKLGFSNDDVAEIGSEAIIALAVTVFIVAIIVPISLQQLNDANTSGFSSTQLALFGLVGTVALLAIVIGIIKHVKG